MVGAAVVRRLATTGCEVITVGREQVDLTRQAEVERWLGQARPDAVIMAAARVGGIHANSTLPADFRDALIAIDLVGLSYAEAARSLGVREATVTTRLYRARQRLASSLAVQDEPKESTGSPRRPNR